MNRGADCVQPLVPALRASDCRGMPRARRGEVHRLTLEELLQWVHENEQGLQEFCVVFGRIAYWNIIER